MSIVLNDQSRFEKFLEVLPEDFVDNFVNFHLFNGHYPKEFIVKLSAYQDNNKKILSQFHNEKINQAYLELNKYFDVLDIFLGKHFWIPKYHEEVNKKPVWLYLEPRYHHNFFISENLNTKEDVDVSAKWGSYKKELDKIAEDFYCAYVSFIKIAKEEIEKNSADKAVGDYSNNINNYGSLQLNNVNGNSDSTVSIKGANPENNLFWKIIIPIFVTVAGGWLLTYLLDKYYL
ncbi:MAG: hypothetical protein PHI32_12160 [Dysgonamonadaceae bacterium]|nr:hypothetical protein [Dysgonamonadaceae bacterium]